MSSTYVLLVGLPLPSSHAAPDFITLPGRYITELPPSSGLGSTVVQVWVVRSSTLVGITSSDEATCRTRPSGSTNMCGYCVGIAVFAPGSCVQVFATGSYTSGVCATHVLQVVCPATARTRPSARVMTVGYQRSTAICASSDHVCV